MFEDMINAAVIGVIAQPETDNFRSAEQLDITEPQRGALIKALVAMEAGKIRHVTDQEYYDYWHERDDYGEELVESRFSGHFNMGRWCEDYDCGSVACLGGTAELLSPGVSLATSLTVQPHLYELFYPDIDTELDEVTVEAAARALRNFLERGNAYWEEIFPLVEEKSGS